MRNLLSSRLLVITVVLVVSVMLLGRNMGIAGSQAPAKISDSDSTLATSDPPQTDWALMGLLLGGTLIALLRPRRKKVVPVTAE